jgi:O-antigen ligase
MAEHAISQTYVSLSPGRERTLPKLAEVAAIPDARVAPIVRLAFYGYVATIPFETVNLGIPVEITAISLGLLLLTLVFQITLCLRKPPVAFICFFVYLAIFALPVVTDESAFSDEAFWQLIVLTQLVVMCWVSFNLMKSEQVARTAITVFATFCVLLAFLQVTGVSETTTNYEESIQRTTSFGFHPNNLARMFALCLLILVGLSYGGMRNPIKARGVVWIMFAVVAFAIIETGSRGGLLALMAGLSFIVLRRGDVKAKIRNVIVLLAGFGIFSFIAFESDVFRSRFDRAMNDGDLARREQIYPTAWAMFLEKPLVGWGGKASEFELGARLAHEEEVSKNPHNLILYILVATGVAGGLPMLLGLTLTAGAAWRARKGPRGVLPLSLFSTVVVANMSGLWLHNKMHWFVLAYTLSSTSVFVVRKVRGPKSDLEVETDGALVEKYA